MENSRMPLLHSSFIVLASPLPLFSSTFITVVLEGELFFELA
jgi:hypothetical protein